MPYLTIHRLDGDPDELLERKRTFFDPVVDAMAPDPGALYSFTARSETGLTVVNVWRSAEDAARFTELSEIEEAQRQSALPTPSSFERYVDADVIDYRARRTGA